jgi:superoxide dismutase
VRLDLQLVKLRLLNRRHCFLPHGIIFDNLLTRLQDAAPPSGELLKLIEARWKNLDSFKTAFNTAAAGVQV